MKREQVKKWKYLDLRQFNCFKTAQLHILVLPGETFEVWEFYEDIKLECWSDPAGARFYVKSRT